ncbi:lipid hydroperoxide peroxidase [Enterobacterales bacterium CwR94]|nr:lipid hydroperoxide peroxidase [Enterobacterales bacterium CwR94]
MSQTVHFQGNPVQVTGKLPQVGQVAPDFTLTAKDLSDKTLDSYKDKEFKIINIFPSIDTGVCAASVRKFNEEATKLQNTVVLCVSVDLPFAQSRFCGADGLSNVITLSAFRFPEFSQAWGVGITDGALRALTARAVVVLDKDNKVLYSQLVDEITTEPDYQAAINALK